MSEGPWHDGRRAWERLAGWYSAGGSPPEAGDPLVALSDVGLVRRLLDEVELEAVRAARRQGRSWAEIATKLGVTRQSAWERWRDLDGEREAPGAPRATMPDVEAQTPAARAAVFDREARAALRREARRQAWVTVPNVVSLPFDEARTVLVERGLVGVPSDPDGPSATALGIEGAVVTDQSPEAGAQAPPGTPVTLWTDRGGGSGVREPRCPEPTPRTGRKFVEEPSGEAVG
jgi:transposase-like protein